MMSTMKSFIVALFAALAAIASVGAFAPAPALKAGNPSATSLGVSVKVNVGEGESIEGALRRFKREVNKSGHLMELRHKRYFENSQERKKRKIVQARNRKRLERMQRQRMNRMNA